MGRHRNILIIALVAVILVAGLSFGMVKAYAQSQDELPTMTPDRLLAEVVDAVSRDLAISGDVVLENRLLGPMGAMGGAGGTFFAQDTEGRVWADGGQLRADILDPQGGDRSLYVSEGSLALYDALDGTLTNYTVPPQVLQTMEAASARHPRFDVTDAQRALATLLEKVEPVASVSLATAERVAGRLCYVLTVVPTSDISLFASLRLAIDGETFVPLRLQVFARADSESVLTAAFTRVSYEPVDESVFITPSSEGVRPQEKELRLPDCLRATGTDGDTPATPSCSATDNCPLGVLERLTLAEAQRQVGFTLLALENQGASYPFQGAFILEMPAAERSTTDDLFGLATGFEGPLVASVYGQGLDTLVLLQTPVTTLQAIALQGTLSRLPFLGTATVGGEQGVTLTTPLLSALGWFAEDRGLVAVGSLPTAELERLATYVR